MAERRRLLIAPQRLAAVVTGDPSVALERSEQHYLRRVLRCRVGDTIDVVDGCGSLWQAQLISADSLQLARPAEQIESAPVPRLGLGLSLIRRGFEDALRMACELGVDEIQPLRADRSTPQAEHRPERWATILQEAVEQCERLWLPTLRPSCKLAQWPNSSDPVAVGVTRRADTPALHDWLNQTTNCNSMVWLLVGPEGGWSDAEEQLSITREWQPVHLGSSILCSSTAAVRGSVELVQWRDG
ncbi:16S rRNA (uracil(1498)-N(3))-methyltransferase [Synechococcus sp. A15-24]|uniref:16S rRNA (uracil(1498)-N(3))-methyltransferase n=1 Tax=Synechococcus sp. A15-24 TaxID=1050635 RepID=UPI001647B845|nr:16S rRNA (uracil(1498)-N(3))-methyltransferase [Synechococcus sp. A15-24]QNJ28939.1 RNA methyltransferase/ RsmE family protein [Synechococcus sp. A15-24]